MARGHGRKAQSQRYRLPKHLKHINLNAGGIDVGSASHFVAVPEDRDTRCVRQFSSFTSNLHEIAGWLRRCLAETLAGRVLQRV